MKLKLTLLTAMLIAFSIQSKAQDEDNLFLNSYVLDPNAKYTDIRQQVKDVMNDSREPTQEGEAENYNAISTGRWDWFWSNRLNASGPNKGGFTEAQKQIYQQMVSPICNTPANNGSNWQLLGPKTQPANSVLGPSMGIVISIAHNPANPAIIYIGTNKSGLWKTVNGGSTWTCMTDNLHLPGLGINSVVLDPANPNTIFIATGFGSDYFEYGVGVLRSNDGGATWITTGLTYDPLNNNQHFAVGKLLIDHPTSGSPFIIYALVHDFVYKSVDGGVNFSSLAASQIPTLSNQRTRNWTDIEIKPNDPNTLYVASDGGGNANPAEVWKTTDAGLTWSVLPAYDATYPYMSDKISIEVSPVETNSIWEIFGTSANPPQLYVSHCWLRKSANSGLTWSNLYSQNVTQGYGTIMAGVGYWRSSFKVSIADPNVIYVGGFEVNKSITGGTSFSLVGGNPSIHVDQRAMDFVSGSTLGSNGVNDVVYACNDGGVAKTTNGSLNWSSINGNGLAINQFYGLCSPESEYDRISGGTQDDGFMTYKPGSFSGNDWRQSVYADAYDCVCDQNFATNNTMYGEQNGGSYTLSKTISGGNPWGSIIPNLPNLSSVAHSHVLPMLTNPVNSNYYVAAHDVYKSPTPAIVNWPNTLGSDKISDFTNANQVRICDGIGAMAVAPSNPNYIYVAFSEPTWQTDLTSCNPNDCSIPCSSCVGTNNCTKSKIFRSTNGGTTWQDIGQYMQNISGVQIGTDAVIWAGITNMVVDPLNPDRMWCTFNNIWTNNGVSANRVNYYHYDSQTNTHSWQDMSVNLPAFPVHKIVYQAGTNDALYVGTDVGVFYTNAAKNYAWECFNDGLPTCIVTDLEINYCHQKIRAATYGRAIWESSLAPSPVIINVSTTWNTPHKLGNDLSIASGVTLTISSDVDIAKSRKITVAPGGTLNITTGAHLFNGCNEMWDKIEVSGPTATLQIHNGAIVEDAMYASYTINGGIIRIDHARLTQNRVHSHIEGSTAQPYSGFIFATTMDNPSGLQSPYLGQQSYQGIEVYNCSDVTIGNDASSANQNSIKDFTLAGIRIQDARTTVINNNINANNTSTSSRGIYALGVNGNSYELNIGTRSNLNSNVNSANQFSNLWMGIFIFKNYMPHIADNDFQLIRIRGIFIRDCVRSIDILSIQNPNGNYIHNSPALFLEAMYLLYNPRVSSIRVLQNRFDLNNSAVAIRDLEYSCTDLHRLFIVGNQVNGTKYGVWVQNDGFSTIDNNRINFLTNPSNNQVGYGIYTINCCFPDITNNIVTGINNPKPVYGICAEMCNSPYLCSNTVTALERGILCRGTMFGTKVKLNVMQNNYYGFCMENGGNIGEQGNSSTGDVSDNQWIGNIYYDTYSIGGSNANPPGNTFFDVQNTANYTINTTYNLPPAQVISQNILNMFNTAACNDHKGWRVMRDAENGITDTIPDTLLTDEERWIKQRQTYEVVTSENIISTPSVVMQDFIQDNAGHPIADFKDIDRYISKAFIDTLSPGPDTVQVDSARIRNLAVADVKLTEFYSKIINDIYLSTAARGNYDFSLDQLEWIYAIAALCPFEAGPAVYRARLLLAFVDDQTWFYDNECDPNSQLRKSKSQQSPVQAQYFNVYPNPANSNLYLDYFLPENSVATLTITDISGKEINKFNLRQYNNHLNVPCRKLSSGIYFYKITTNGSIAKSGKVSVIH